MSDDAQIMEIFLDIQSGMPRQGPGSISSTKQALSYCKGLPDNITALDIGCGPGEQTSVLANTFDGSIIALDYFPQYLYELRDNTPDNKQVFPVNADMNDLPFFKNCFDVILCEGAIYITGFENGLKSWKGHLKPQSYFVVNDLVWLVDNPPAEVADFFAEGYADRTGLAQRLETIEQAGYVVHTHFTQPDSDWWDKYYTPLERKLSDMKAKYADNELALSIIAGTEQEIEMRRKYPDAYGYHVFILSPVTR